MNDLTAPDKFSHNSDESSIERNGVRITLSDIGEGLCGDYDEEDPSDVPLLRYDVYVNEELAKVNCCTDDISGGVQEDEGTWYIPQDTSYCTQLPVTLDESQKEMALKMLMDNLFDSLLSGSPKRDAEYMSWISLADLAGSEKRGWVVETYIKRDGVWVLP